MIATDANLTYNHTSVQLNISTDSLVLKRLTDFQVLFSHKMEGISFASAGENVRNESFSFIDHIRGIFRKQRIISPMWLKIIPINVHVMFYHVKKMNH